LLLVVLDRGWANEDALSVWLFEDEPVLQGKREILGELVL
jgi:hypothetical protein